MRPTAARDAIRWLARGAFLLAALAGAAVALLVDIPFTYQAVVRAGLLPWLPAVMAGLPWVLLVAAAANLLTEAPGPASRWASERRILLIAAGLGAGLLVAGRVWSSLSPGPAAKGCILAFLLAAGGLLAFDLLDLQEDWPIPSGKTDEARRLLLASSAAAALVAGAFFAIGLLRALSAGVAPDFREAATTLGWSLLTHGLLLTLAAVAVLGLQAAAGFFPKVQRAEFLIHLAATAGFIAFLLRAIAFPGLAFAGPFAWSVALLLGVCLAAALALAGLRLAPRGGAPASALETFLRPLHPMPPSRLGLAAGLLAALALALAVSLRVSRFDWNHLFQQLGAVLVTGLVFAALYLRQSSRVEAHSWSTRLFAAPLILLALVRIWGDPQVRPTAGWLPRPSAAAVERHGGFDASARLAGALLRLSAPVGESIYPLLLANSNLPHAVPIPAKDLKLVDPLGAATVERPDIYIFVVDSLRQDYLGAYNPKVGFTPSLDRFAAESTVIPRAFTRYGATGLSEPSIWVGGMILHKQYIVPFHPLNTLQKLITADGYRPMISMDSILDVIVQPTPDLEQLDAGIGTGDLRLGSTLQELMRKLDRIPSDRPVFVYSQAQDLHISSIRREGAGVPGGGEYPGFDAPYASRVRRLDAEFGAFIQYLKDRGRFDRSLIIFTSDHGDSLGEEGRFGHAYTLFPEIMRVPLLLRVPEKLRAGLQMDPDRAAFLTDISPTLHYLLGHRPLISDPVLGRPLFTATQAEQDRYRRDHHLIASSYGAVWGILSGDGSRLYISDGVNFRDHCFDLTASPGGAPVPVTPALKRRYDRLIVQDLEHLNAFYGFQPGK